MSLLQYESVRVIMHISITWAWPSSDKAMLSVLPKDTSVTAGVSDSHSADPKHQSVNSVLLTTLPRHFHSIDVVKST